MHDTTLPLGRYAKDPRFRIVEVGHHDAIRTARVTIIKDGDRYQVWELADPDAITPAFTSKSLSRALAYDLGEAQKVGPVGMREWLHTDGRTYRHDPATTGMIGASSLRLGDVVDFPHLEAFEIVGEQVNQPDGIGEWHLGYPVRLVTSGKASWFVPRPGDMVPIRFAR